MIKKNYKYLAGRASALVLAAILTAMPLQAADTGTVSKLAAAENQSEDKAADEAAKKTEIKAEGGAEEKTEIKAEDGAEEKTEIKAEGGAEDAAKAAKTTDKEENDAESSDTPDGSPLEFKYIYTKDGIEDLPAERAANLKQAIQTNAVSSWPEGPAVGAAGAIVMDADSGEVLYGKNIYMHLYPASITKVLTGLLAYENLSPSDKITFSENAVFGIERGSSNIGMDVGETITVDQALYGLMVASANEVAVALGERVSGTESDFVSLMNARAWELGCRNTNFVTTNGLHDQNHYTCAFDMALIAREAFRHPQLVEYMSQANYEFKSTDTQPDDFWIGNTNSFLNGVFSCDGVIGGKTGYTDQARETLVTFAERDGKRLICVIMREEPPYQYYDTIDLLNYAFDNFQQVSIAENETDYTMQDSRFLYFGSDIFGKGTPPISIAEDALLMLPNDASFSDLSSEIEPFADGTAEAAQDGSRILGVIHYHYNGYELGTANVLFKKVSAEGEEVHGIRAMLFGLVHTGAQGSIYLNILLLIPIVLAAAFLLCVLFWIRSYFVELDRQRKKRTRRRNGRSAETPPSGSRNGRNAENRNRSHSLSQNNAEGR